MRRLAGWNASLCLVAAAVAGAAVAGAAHAYLPPAPQATQEPITEPAPIQLNPTLDPVAAPVASPVAAPVVAPHPGSSQATGDAAATSVHWDTAPNFEPAPRHHDANGHLTDQGEASWYGADFAGLPTASGEIFDMYAFTVAHPSWPLGSVIRVHNLENDRSVLARINDRGPYARGRIVDCSLAIARALDFTGQGFATVQITLLDSLPDAWTRFTGLGMPVTLGTPRFSELLQARHTTPAAAVLALSEDTSPAVPLAVNAVIDTAVSEHAVFRTASVLPFPAILHAWEHVSRWLLGPEGAPSRWLRIEHRLDGFGLRAVLRLFTQP